MSINKLPQLTNFRTILEWSRVFDDCPQLVYSGQDLSPIPDADFAAMILLCMRQVAPFSVTAALCEKRIMICQGCRELYSLHNFFIGNIPIKREEWYFSIPFFTDSPECYYQQLPLHQQSRILSASVHAQYLKVDNMSDFKLLYRYYN